MNALDYFLKANLYGLLFAGCYWILLRRHTFFSLNRAYLLASAVLSLALPLVSLPTQTAETLPGLDWPVPVGVITLPVSAAPIDAAEIVPVAAQPDWEQIGLIAYGLIALALALLLSVRTARLVRLIRQSPKQVRQGYVLVQPNDLTIPTFSFFRYVILNPADTHNDLIIQHELVHVRQYHSADVVSMALVRAVMWGCPALWLIDYMLRQVHEFLADKPVGQPNEYARFLVDYSFGLQPSLRGSHTLTNSFFKPSLLKQRILMLHRKATTRWALAKYGLILPLAFGLLAMTTAREEIADIVRQTTDNTITVSGRVTSVDGKPLPGANVVIANTGKGTPTDRNGFYKLFNVSVSSKLAFSHIGYRTDILLMEALSYRAKNHQLTLSPRLIPNLQDELPPMGASAAYKAVKLNPAMPVRTPPALETLTGKALTAVEEPAVFPTGVVGLMQYVAQNLRYPTKAKLAGIQGDVYIVFTVLPTGTVGDVKINKNIKGIGGGCEEEAVRIVSQMPNWIPATQNGKAVAVRYQIPIRFALEKREDKRTGQVYPEKFHPTDSPIGDFPTVRDVNYPNQPRLTTVLVPAGSFKADDSSQPDTNKKTSAIPNNSKYAKNDLLGGAPGKPLLLLNGKTEITSLESIDTKDVERTEFMMTPKAQVLYGPKAADGVVKIYMKGAWEQDPAFVKKTFLEIISNPAKETEYHINRKIVTDKEVEKLKIENIRAIEWHKTPDTDRLFDIVEIYTK